MCAQVKQAEQQAVIYQHETEAARLRQVAQGKDDVIGKFKQLVQDNQNAAEKLRQECERWASRCLDYKRCVTFYPASPLNIITT